MMYTEKIRTQEVHELQNWLEGKYSLKLCYTTPEDEVEREFYIRTGQFGWLPGGLKDGEEKLAISAELLDYVWFKRQDHKYKEEEEDHDGTSPVFFIKIKPALINEILEELLITLKQNKLHELAD